MHASDLTSTCVPVLCHFLKRAHVTAPLCACPFLVLHIDMVLVESSHQDFK